MSEPSDHAVLLSEKIVHVFTNPANPILVSLMAGTMIKILGDAKKSLGKIAIFNERAMRPYNQNQNVYCTLDDNVRIVSKIIWDMAIAIEDRERRLNFVCTPRSSDIETLVVQMKNQQIVVRGYDHLVNGTFLCMLYKVRRMLGKPGLYFIVKILVIYIFVVQICRTPTNIKKLCLTLIFNIN